MLSSLFIYLFGASVYMALFYGLYRLLYRRLTFHAWNRALILGMVFFALLAPLLPAAGTFLEHTPQTFAGKPIPSVVPFITGAGSAYAPVTRQAYGHFSWLAWAGLLYAAGLVAALIALGGNMRQLARILRTGQMEKIPGFKLIHYAPVNASFFKTIFLREDLGDAETTAVLLHEKYHAVKWHSLDNAFMELLKVFLWFHPLVYQFHRLLREQHEFEVDACMTGQMDAKQYAYLLLRLSTPVYVPLINGYSVSPLTKRIHLLFKTPHTVMKKTMYLLLVPAAALSVVISTPFIHAQELQKVTVRDVEVLPMKGLYSNEDDNSVVLVLSLREIIGKDASSEAFDRFSKEVFPMMAQSFTRNGWNLAYHVEQGPGDKLLSVEYGLADSSNGVLLEGTAWRVKEVLDNHYLIMCYANKKSRTVRFVSFSPAEVKKYLGYNLPAYF
jgi:beta-lactamase regulating signal transducer with metallopeptidase domain